MSDLFAEYRFIGSETALLPYRTGEVYQLLVRPGGWGERMRGWNFIIEAPFLCPYVSKESFLQNWQLVDADTAPPKNEGEKNDTKN